MERQRRELWARGLKDYAVGAAVGLSTDSIKDWREKQGLVANKVMYCPCCGVGKRMTGLLVSPDEKQDCYRYWKCAECGGEFWPDDGAQGAG